MNALTPGEDALNECSADAVQTAIAMQEVAEPVWRCNPPRKGAGGDAGSGKSIFTTDITAAFCERPDAEVILK